MLWLYILLGVLLLAALVLLMPVTLRAVYDESFRCDLYVGFVKIRLAPSKPKKQKKKKKKKQPQKSKTEKSGKKEPNAVQKYGLSWLISVIRRVARLAGSALKDFFARITVKRLMLSISLAGDDAADTAVKYGKCCAAVYPAVSAAVGAVRCREYGVDISPDFDENAETEIKLDLCARVCTVSLLGLVIKHGIKGLKLLAQIKSEQKDIL